MLYKKISSITTETVRTNNLCEYRDRTHTYWPANVVAFSWTICFAFMLNGWPSTKLSDVVVWMLTADKYVVQASLEISVYVLPLKRSLFPTVVCKRTPCYLCQVCTLLEYCLTYFLESVQFVKEKSKFFMIWWNWRHFVVSCFHAILASVSVWRNISWYESEPLARWWNTFYLPPS